MIRHKGEQMGATYFWYARRIMELRQMEEMTIRYVIRVTYFWYARRIMEVRHKDRKMTIRYVIRVTYFWYARRIMEVCLLYTSPSPRD